MSQLLVEPINIRRDRRTSMRVQSGVLGMAIFLMAETMLFAGLISAATVLRGNGASMGGFDDQPRLPMWLTVSNMLVLLASGLVLVLSRGERRRVTLATVLGAVFLVVQGVEWTRLIAHGFTASTGVASGIFYAIVGTHAAHVIGGLACLSFALIRLNHESGQQTLKVCALYWYFVVIIWPLLYVTVYF